MKYTTYILIIEFIGSHKMSGNRGLNSNQNHNAKSSNSTRVLQPPGGSSSISFGGGSDYKTTSSSNYSAKSAGAKKSYPSINTNSAMNMNEPYEDRPSPSKSRRRGVALNDVGDDALDMVMSKSNRRGSSGSNKDGGSIPGLESHYNGGNYGSQQDTGSGQIARRSMRISNYADDQPEERRSSGRGSDNRRLSSSDYANALRDQINEKSRINRGDNGIAGSIGRRRGNSPRADSNDEQQMIPSNSRSRKNPPGGRSSISLT